MKYGATIFPTQYSISPASLALALEERGFESLWVAEHTHIPVCRSTPWPGGADLPRMYYDLYSPLIALAAAAAVTKNLRLGTGISLVAQHDPITLAKDVATLDRISNGRFLFGVGGGWNAEEMANHGTDASRRWKLMRERIEAMKAIWREEKAEYHGEFVNFDPIYSWPKPVQQPHPPIHVAGEAPWAVKRALRYGDGWIPIAGRGQHEVEAQMKTFHELAAQLGRDPAEVEVTIYAAVPDEEVLERYRDSGVSRAVFFLMPEEEERVLPVLDQLAELARGVG